MPIGKNEYKRSDLFGDRFFSFIVCIANEFYFILNHAITV